MLDILHPVVSDAVASKGQCEKKVKNKKRCACLHGIMFMFSQKGKSKPVFLLAKRHEYYVVPRNMA